MRYDWQPQGARDRVIAILLLFACSADPGYGGRSTDEWMRQLHDRDPQARESAAKALGQVLDINPKAHDVVDALIIALSDSSDDVRLATASALTAKDVDLIGAMAGFHAVLHDSAHARVRESMALIIGSLGAERARMLVPHLREGLSDSMASVRTTAAESLGMLGPAARSEAYPVAELINDPEPSVRLAAIQSLVSLRPGGTVITSAARAGLTDSTVAVRVASAYALSSLGPEAVSALPELVTASSDSESRVREAAAFAIGGIGAAAASAIPTLKGLLNDSSKSVVNKAQRALTVLETGARH